MHQPQPQVKYRDMVAQIFLMIITFGFYSIYWFYQTATEMEQLSGEMRADPAMLTLLLFVPFAAIYSWYKYAELYEEISPDRFNRWILFILWIFFAPAVWLIVQSELNKRSTYR